MVSYDNIRTNMERTILTTFLYQDLMPSKDFIEILRYRLDYNLFKGNLTIKSVAKAIRIFQDDELPIDDILIVNFLSKKMAVDYDEFTKILTTLCVPYRTLMSYIDKLKENENKTVGDDLYARI